MSDHIQKLIEDATVKLRQQEALVVETKKFINQVCSFAGMEQIYPDSDLTVESVNAAPAAVQRNSFYGKPLATCVREFLTSRERSGTREATLAEIMSALKQGSYDLETISKEAGIQNRGVAISLAKNTATFHRLPNGDWGLAEWYPNVKAKKEKNGSSKTDADLLPDEDVQPATAEESTGDATAEKEEPAGDTEPEDDKPSTPSKNPDDY